MNHQNLVRVVYRNKFGKELVFLDLNTNSYLKHLISKKLQRHSFLAFNGLRCLARFLQNQFVSGRVLLLIECTIRNTLRPTKIPYCNVIFIVRLMLTQNITLYSTSDFVKYHGLLQYCVEVRASSPSHLDCWFIYLWYIFFFTRTFQVKLGWPSIYISE